MTDLETSMATIIAVFQKYSKREGDAHKLKKSELRDLLHDELPDLMGVRHRGASEPELSQHWEVGGVGGGGIIPAAITRNTLFTKLEGARRVQQWIYTAALIITHARAHACAHTHTYINYLSLKLYVCIISNSLIGSHLSIKPNVKEINQMNRLINKFNFRLTVLIDHYSLLIIHNLNQKQKENTQCGHCPPSRMVSIKQSKMRQFAVFLVLPNVTPFPESDVIASCLNLHL